MANHSAAAAGLIAGIGASAIAAGGAAWAQHKAAQLIAPAATATFDQESAQDATDHPVASAWRGDTLNQTKAAAQYHLSPELLAQSLPARFTPAVCGQFMKSLAYNDRPYFHAPGEGNHPGVIEGGGERGGICGLMDIPPGGLGVFVAQECPDFINSNGLNWWFS